MGGSSVVASQTREITRNSERIRPYSSSRSSKVINLGVNRKPICDFLLVINSNFSRIWYRFRDIDAWRQKVADFTHPSLVWGPHSGGPHQNFGMKLTRKKLEGLLYGENCVILASTVFDWSTHVTDRQTDGIAIAYMRYSIYAVACKNWFVIYGQSSTRRWRNGVLLSSTNYVIRAQTPTLRLIQTDLARGSRVTLTSNFYKW